jgi:outer membrane receptor protein involved in Fe transport
VVSSPWENQWLQRLRGSIDYYDILVEGAILALDTNAIIASCYNYYGTNPNFSAQDPNCLALKRAGGQLSSTANPNSTAGTFPTINGGELEAEGIDFQVDYGFDMEWLGLAPGWGQWRFNAIVTHLFEFVEQLPGGPPPIDLAGTVNYFGSGDGRFTTSHPEWRANLNARWELGDFDLAARVRYIAGMEHRLTREFPGETGFTAPDSVTYLDLNGGWKLTDNAELRLGVNNVFDKQPPSYAPNVQSGTDPSLYDVIGRRVFFGVNLRY